MTELIVVALAIPIIWGIFWLLAKGTKTVLHKIGVYIAVRRERKELKAERKRLAKERRRRERLERARTREAPRLERERERLEREKSRQ